MSDSFVTPWTVACQADMSMEFSRQEYWTGLPFLSPGDLPDSGIEPGSPALAGRFFTFELPAKPLVKTYSHLYKTSIGNVSSCELSTFLII